MGFNGNMTACVFHEKQLIPQVLRTCLVRRDQSLLQVDEQRGRNLVSRHHFRVFGQNGLQLLVVLCVLDGLKELRHNFSTKKKHPPIRITSANCSSEAPALRGTSERQSIWVPTKTTDQSGFSTGLNARMRCSQPRMFLRIISVDSLGLFQIVPKNKSISADQMGSQQNHYLRILSVDSSLFSGPQRYKTIMASADLMAPFVTN